MKRYKLLGMTAEEALSTVTAPRGQDTRTFGCNCICGSIHF